MVVNVIGKFGCVDFETFVESLRTNQHIKRGSEEEAKLGVAYSRVLNNMPKRASNGSAGYDIITPIDLHLESNKSVVVPTGLTSEIENGWVLFIVPRSGLGCKYGVRLLNTVGVIDSDYRGQILLKFTAEKDIVIHAGDRIAQGIFLPFGVVEGDTLVDNDNITERGAGGFGSTGR